MYLTISHPEIARLVATFSGGIWVTPVAGEISLIFKTSKEVILTAKVNEGFKMYLAPVEINTQKSFVIVTAFQDDHDEPLTIRTPLVFQDVGSEAILEFFKSQEFSVFFFDENNRELLSYKAIGDFSSARERLLTATLLDRGSVSAQLDKAEHWFFRRTEADDSEAIEIKLVESLFPDDFVILHADYERHPFVASNPNWSSALVRQEPGANQELDIAFLLQRVFDAGHIYINPIKVSDGKEFVDIMVLGENTLYLIQAKDSPNTAAILKNTVQRKKLKSISQVSEAAVQLKGAIAFAKKNNGLKFAVNCCTVEIDITGKQLIGIIVVKELFNDSFHEYGSIAFKLIDDSQTPAVFFDYPELHRLTQHSQGEDEFLHAIHQIFSFAVGNGHFPRLRYAGKR